MAEWSKARDSKSRMPLKGIEGSNPSLSATSLASDVAPPPLALLPSLVRRQ